MGSEEDGGEADEGDTTDGELVGEAVYSSPTYVHGCFGHKPDVNC